MGGDQNPMPPDSHGFPGPHRFPMPSPSRADRCETIGVKLPSVAFNLKLPTNFQITKKSEKGLPKNLSFHTIQQDPTTSTTNLGHNQAV